MAAQTPAAPQIPNLMLSVFVHRSVPETSNGNHGNGRRLALLGDTTLPAAHIAALNALFAFQGAELENHHRATFPRFVNNVVSVYGWRAKMYGVPKDTDLNDAQETLYIFKAYAGGVHHTYGQHALEQWVRQLVQAGF